MSKLSSPRLLYRLQYSAAFLGTALSVYLLTQHTRLKSGIQESSSFCTLSRFADCDVVNASRFSEFLGLPLASWGAGFFFFCFLISILAKPGSNNFYKVQSWIGWTSLMGLVVDTALFGIQVFALGTVCLFCFLTYGCTLLLFMTTGCLGPTPVRSLQTFAQNILSYRPSFRLQIKTNQLVLSALAYGLFTAVILLLPGQIRIRSQLYSFQQQLHEYYEKWKTRTKKDISWNADDGRLGEPDSKVKLVIFSDFECPHCRKAAFTLHTVLKPQLHRYFLVFKHFPLDSACNPSIPFQMHPRACQLAQLAVCAQKKGKFWQFHDQLFLNSKYAAGIADIDELKKDLAPIFSPSEISHCLQSQEPLRAIGQDIKQANALNIKGTPSLFINGKSVEIPITVDTLTQLLQMEEGLP